MRSTEDLFNNRSTVGSKLEKILADESYTKTKFCKEAKISRPTLDKLLSGNLTSMVNYEKHMKKVMECLKITPDTLLGKEKQKYNRTNMIRNQLQINREQISERTGIPVARLEEIEAGKTAAMAEYRDIAVCLDTSVRGLLNENVFALQSSCFDFFYGAKESIDYISGFWGHIGIKIKGSDGKEDYGEDPMDSRYLWYPVTGKEKGDFYRSYRDDQVVIPCLNNKILYINMKNVEHVIFMNEACDPPVSFDWTGYGDDWGLPMAVYEAMEDYFYYHAEIPGKEELEKMQTGNPDEETAPADENEEWRERLSLKMIAVLRELEEKGNWDEYDISQMIHGIKIYFQDGSVVETDINYDEEETLSFEVESLYTCQEPYEENYGLFSDYSGLEHFINLDKVSLIELPLAATEEKIWESTYKQILGDKI